MNNSQNDPELEALHQKIEGVRDLVCDGISNSLERGERLEELSRQTRELAQSAKGFQRVARKTRRQECCVAYRYGLWCVGMISVGVVGLGMLSCGFKFDQC